MRLINTRRYIVILLLIIPFISVSQPKLKLVFNSDTLQKITSSYTTVFKDTIESNKYLHELKLKAIKKGFLLASIDSKTIKNDTLYCNVFIGPLIKHATVKYKPNDRIWLYSSGRNREQLLSESVFSSNEVYEIIYNSEKKLINSGYPFAQISLINLFFKTDTICCELQIQKNNYFSWGNIIDRGEYKLPEKLSSILLGIKKNETYSEEDMQNISNRIRQHPYIEETQPFEILYTGSTVDIYLYLKSKPISSSSGTIGLQQKSNSNGYTLIGDFKLKLINVLKNAESIDLQWKNLQNNSQFLKSSFVFPSILRTPIGSEFQFQLFKRDTSFLELKSAISVQYFLKSGFTIKINYKHISSSTLNTSLNPTLGNVNSNYYGFSINKSRIDYLPCPTKGYIFNVDLSVGVRNSEDKILSSKRIENTSKTEYNFTYYLSLSKRNIIKLNQTTEIFSAPSYFQNELIRFGGMNSQRGFREEELRATSRIYNSIEYRFLLDRNSYLFMFYDQSWYENKISLTNKRDTPLGFGSGLSFGTDIGIFSISYAIGRQLNNPFLIKNGNIHFGYISYF